VPVVFLDTFETLVAFSLSSSLIFFTFVFLISFFAIFSAFGFFTFAAFLGVLG